MPPPACYTTGQVHDYPTRNAQDFSIYKAKTVFADRAIILITRPTSWNSLDTKLKYAKWLSTLETNLNQLLLLIMINFAGFWRVFVLCFSSSSPLFFIIYLFIYLFIYSWHTFFECNLVSQWMVFSGLFWPFAISSISFCLYLLLIWCRLYVMML